KDVAQRNMGLLEALNNRYDEGGVVHIMPADNIEKNQSRRVHNFISSLLQPHGIAMPVFEASGPKALTRLELRAQANRERYYTTHPGVRARDEAKAQASAYRSLGLHDNSNTSIGRHTVGGGGGM